MHFQAQEEDEKKQLHSALTEKGNIICKCLYMVLKKVHTTEIEYKQNK